MEPFIGIFVALAAILLGNLLEGGHASSIVGGPAMMIVLGGTVGAVLVQFPLATVSASIKICAGTFKKCKYDNAKLVDEIVDYANRARRDGILALEKVAGEVTDPFLAKALTMAVDGVDSATLRDTMDVTIGQHEEHGEDAAKVFEALGGYSPTIGIIGAVLGLIHVMSNLSDINAVGSGIAAAFVATIYGVGFANIICLPLGGRIKFRARDQAKLKEMMLTGVLAIQEGTNPKLIREKLAGYLSDHKTKAEGGAREAAAAAA